MLAAMNRKTYMHYLLIICLSYQQLFAGFYSFYHLVHPQTDQRIVLLGDYHVKNQHANQNRAAIINLAHLYDAQVIVEDMSDFSLWEDYFDCAGNNLFRDFIAERSVHSNKRFAYTSLSLTYHCQRKNIAVSNVEFRHSSIDTLTLLPSDLFLYLMRALQLSISDRTLALLDDEHSRCYREFYGYYEQLVDAYPTLDLPEQEVLEAQMPSNSFLNILILNEMVRAFANEHSMVIVCAGGWHNTELLPMLKKMGFAVKASIGYHEDDDPVELRLERIFKERVVGDNKLPRHASRSSVGFHDKKRVSWPAFKKALASGAILSTLITMLTIFSRYQKLHKSW